MDTRQDTLPPCTSESDLSFCQRMAPRSCATATGLDNCGRQRTVERCETCSVTSCASDGYCAPLCRTATFAIGAPIADINVDGQQDLLLGASRKGDTILHLRRPSCFSDAFRLFISDKSGGVFTSRELTDQVNLKDLRKDQAFEPISYLSITPDGRAIIGVSGDGRRFLISNRSGAGVTDFAQATAGPFTAINDSIAATSAVFADPLLSGDGLSFFYKIINDGAVQGLYEAVRRTPSETFSPGAKLAPVAQAFQSAKGVSADRLTLYLLDVATEPWHSVVLSRRDPTQAFSNPNAPNPPPTVPGFRNTVVEDCSLLIGNETNGGCPGEDIFVINAQ